MLEAIRKRTASIVVKAFLGLLILSFAVWGIGDIFRGRGADTTVATIGDVKIQPQQVNTEMRQELERLRAIFGGQLDMEQARALGMVDRVVQRIVDRTLYDLGGRALGVTISDGQVRNRIQSMKEFRDSAGNFNRFAFETTLQNNGLTEAGFVSMLRGDVSRNQYLGSIGAGATAPDALAKSIYRHRQEKRVAETLYITDASVPEPAIPEDSVLAKFHEENAQRFTAPEYRKLTYVTLLAEDLAKEIAVPEDKVQEAYDDRSEEYAQPEQRRLEQILLSEEEDANRAYGMIEGGADFAATAKEVANTESDALDLGMFTKNQLLPELAAQAFSLGKGGITSPIQSPLGWHILRVAEIEPNRTRTLDEVRDELTKAIALEIAVDGLNSLANRLEDELGGGATLEEAAGSLNLAIQTIASTDASGRNAAGSPVKDLPVGPEFLNLAFQTPEGSESRLTEMGNFGYFILRVDRVTAPTLKPLQVVRNEVISAWKAQQRTKAAEKAASDLLERLKGGEDIFTAAGDMNREVTVTEPFTRSPQVIPEKLSGALVSSLFKVNRGQAVMGRSGRGYTVARLKEVTSVDPAADKKGYDAVKADIQTAIRADLMAQLGAALRQRYPATINTQAVQQLF